MREREPDHSYGDAKQRRHVYHLARTFAGGFAPRHARVACNKNTVRYRSGTDSRRTVTGKRTLLMEDLIHATGTYDERSRLRPLQGRTPQNLHRHRLRRLVGASGRTLERRRDSGWRLGSDGDARPSDDRTRHRRDDGAAYGGCGPRCRKQVSDRRSAVSLLPKRGVVCHTRCRRAAEKRRSCGQA